MTLRADLPLLELPLIHRAVDAGLECFRQQRRTVGEVGMCFAREVGSAERGVDLVEQSARVLALQAARVGRRAGAGAGEGVDDAAQVLALYVAPQQVDVAAAVEFLPDRALQRVVELRQLE